MTNKEKLEVSKMLIDVLDVFVQKMETKFDTSYKAMVVDVNRQISSITQVDSSSPSNKYKIPDLDTINVVQKMSNEMYNTIGGEKVRDVVNDRLNKDVGLEKFVHVLSKSVSEVLVEGSNKMNGDNMKKFFRLIFAESIMDYEQAIKMVNNLK